jgi:hypothetical protein
MTCPFEKQVISFITNELQEKERVHFLQHLKTCSGCDTLVHDFQETSRSLQRRVLPDLPDSLTKACMETVLKEFSAKKTKPAFRLFRLPFSGQPFGPAIRCAFVLVIFFFGLGFGKLLFAPPNWLKQYEKIMHRKIAYNKLDDTRYLRNYFLNVETFLLEMANLEDPSKIDDEDWKMEMKIASHILHRTRQIKHMAETQNEELHTLLADIETVIEDVIDTPKQEFAYFSHGIQNTIDESRLLTKIHGFIS